MDSDQSVATTAIPISAATASAPASTPPEMAVTAMTGPRVEVTQIFTEEEITFDYYSCQEAIDRLNDYLDHELGSAERADVVRHLQICRPCLERFRFEERLIVTLKRHVTTILAPKPLHERLGSAIRVAGAQPHPEQG